MGPWASAIIAVAAVLAFFIAVFAFRGFMETVGRIGNRCEGCGRDGSWPLPLAPHLCWRCRHSASVSTASSHRVGRR